MIVSLVELSDERLREWAEGCRAAAEAQRRGVAVLERRADWIESELARRASETAVSGREDER